MSINTFKNQWYPFLKFTMSKYKDIYNRDDSKDDKVDADDLSIGQLRQYFSSVGLKVKEQ